MWETGLQPRVEILAWDPEQLLIYTGYSHDQETNLQGPQ